MQNHGSQIFFKVADLSPIHFPKQSYRWHKTPDLNIGELKPGFGGLIQGQVFINDLSRGFNLTLTDGNWGMWMIWPTGVALPKSWSLTPSGYIIYSCLGREPYSSSWKPLVFQCFFCRAPYNMWPCNHVHEQKLKQFQNFCKDERRTPNVKANHVLNPIGSMELVYFPTNLP